MHCPICGKFLSQRLRGHLRYTHFGSLQGDEGVMRTDYFMREAQQRADEPVRPVRRVKADTEYMHPDPAAATHVTMLTDTEELVWGKIHPRLGSRFKALGSETLSDLQINDAANALVDHGYVHRNPQTQLYHQVMHPKEIRKVLREGGLLTKQQSTLVERYKVPAPQNTVGSPDAIHGTLSVKAAAQATGYSQPRVQRALSQGVVVDAYRDEKGRWRIPAPVRIRTKDGSVVTWSKSPGPNTPRNGTASL